MIARASVAVLVCLIVESCIPPMRGVPATLSEDGERVSLIVFGAWNAESGISTELGVFLGIPDARADCLRFDGVVVMVNGIEAIASGHCPTSVTFKDADADALREAEELDITLEDETGTAHAVVKNPMRLPAISWKTPESGVVAAAGVAIVDVFPGTEGFYPWELVAPDDGSASWWAGVDGGGPNTLALEVPEAFPAGPFTITLDPPEGWIYSVVECSGVGRCEARREEEGGGLTEDPGPVALQGTVGP
jgi:hypothetical protein